MIKHIVFWKLTGNTEEKQANGAEIKRMLEAVAQNLEGINSLGVYFNLEPDNYDICLDSSFTDMEALDRYQKDPAHLEAKAFIGTVTCGRAAVDYEI